ncbi:TPA: phage N-6-adenine-methyltransferase [Escherichia coli]|nr:phage N-6-adenine-methyltransferase [Escherichia coli]PWD77676.1 phage N-6-adenine-methyltransferase [Escherichia coli]HAH3742654.1 hypothetical protein [Escherichia coli]HAY4065666.1 phage N-6-adenine-methyltransferase [Escherichia coli]
MKNIAAQMVNFDREQMRRIANNMPEQYDEKPQVQQVAQIINGVFSQLLATFPASLANRDQNELNEIRRQWVLAFRENGITTMEQVNAGMRVARRQNRPFLPSPGQFVAWCREEASVNPPYSNIRPWVEKAAEQCRQQRQTVVMLVPEDMSVGWFSKALESVDEVRIITDGRINFIEPSTGLEKKGNSKGSMLLIWRPFISPRRMFTTVSKAALMAIGQGVRRAA